uniref:Uncharacterized protein n=1 Tax=Phenylobacterium glaciei TaxID=2803784 RepID=A0A974P6W5_9CAUL|nr:hypothetical protein JKL49_08185 [Phenylobacterium glaciei]
MADTTETEIGVFWRLVSRRSAVTTTSDSPIALGVGRFRRPGGRSASQGHDEN